MGFEPPMSKSIGGFTKRGLVIAAASLGVLGATAQAAPIGLCGFDKAAMAFAGTDSQ